METQKRLYRVNENKMILGVCSGIAEYTGTDVGVIRIITVLVALTTGIPIILYLVIGLVLPIKEVEMKRAETVEEDEYSYNEDDYKY